MARKEELKSKIDELVREGADYQEIKNYLVEEQVNPDDSVELLRFGNELILDRDAKPKSRQPVSRKGLFVALLIMAIGIAILFVLREAHPLVRPISYVLIVIGFLSYAFLRFRGYSRK